MQFGCNIFLSFVEYSYRPPWKWREMSTYINLFLFYAVFLFLLFVLLATFFAWAQGTMPLQIAPINDECSVLYVSSHYSTLSLLSPMCSPLGLLPPLPPGVWISSGSISLRIMGNAKAVRGFTWALSNSQTTPHWSDTLTILILIYLPTHH